MKKPSLAILIGAGKPKGDAGDDEEPESGEGSSSLMKAAKALLEAIKDEDAEAVAAALKAAHASCKAYDDDEEADEDKGSEE